MYEVDFTGWTRTPEALEELKKKNWKRFKFHFRRVLLSIKYRRGWSNIIYCISCLFDNTKNI